MGFFFVQTSFTLNDCVIDCLLQISRNVPAVHVQMEAPVKKELVIMYAAVLLDMREPTASWVEPSLFFKN